MYFIKLAPIAASDPVKTWQTLHATAMESNRAFGSTLQGPCGPVPASAIPIAARSVDLPAPLGRCPG